MSQAAPPIADPDQRVDEEMPASPRTIEATPSIEPSSDTQGQASVSALQLASDQAREGQYQCTRMFRFHEQKARKLLFQYTDEEILEHWAEIRSDITLVIEEAAEILRLQETTAKAHQALPCALERESNILSVTASRLQTESSSNLAAPSQKRKRVEGKDGPEEFERIQTLRLKVWDRRAKAINTRRIIVEWEAYRTFMDVKAETLE